LVVVSFIGYLTIEKLPWAMLAGVLASIFLFFGLSKVTTQSVEVQEKVDWLAALRNMRGFMLPLVGMMVTRAMLIATFNTFLTTYMTAEGSSLSLAGLSLSILELAGVVGAFLSGVLSDKIGRIRMLVISFIFTPIFMLLFVQSTGVIKILLLILVGFFGLSVTPVMMAIVIESYPEQKSFANGMYMMVNFIISAVAVLLVGFLSDLFTLRFAFLISTAILPFGLFFIWLLRREKDKAINDAPSV
jgi:FSR family fosmidomycin resistance protein-like MFS transporter